MFKTNLPRKLVIFFLASFLLYSLFFPSGQTSILLAADYDLSNSDNYDATLDGASDGDRLTEEGSMEIGDVNGDGVNDIVVGVAFASYNGTDAGSVYVIFGGTTLSGNNSLSVSSNYNIRFDGGSGDQLSRYDQILISDVNGDGNDDLVLGACCADDGGTSDTGAAFVIFSTLIDDVGSTTGNVKPLTTSSNYNIKYTGANADGYLTNSGNMVSGDVNADGFNDLILGATNEDNNGTDSGSVYVMFSTLIDDVGSTTGNDKSLGTGSNYNIRFDGPSASLFLSNNDFSGGVPAGLEVGDINGDGNDDLVMGSKRTDYNSVTDGGSAWVMFSTLIDDVGETTGNNKPLSTSSNYNIRFDGTNTANLTSEGAVVAGDVNGDGLGDLVLGGFGADLSSSGTGGAWVMFSTLIDDVGETTGNNKYLDTSSNYNVRYHGHGGNSSNDSRITDDGAIRIGDLNGDGNTDLVIGAPTHSINGGSGRGDAFVIFSTLIDDVGTTTGNNKSLEFTTSNEYNILYHGENSSHNLTQNGVFAIADIDNDGSEDLLVGNQTGVSNKGYLWVIYSSTIQQITGTSNEKGIDTTGNYDNKYIGGSSSEFLNYHGALGVGDINGDGGNELILGGRDADIGGTDSGSLYIFYSNAAPNTPSSLAGHVDGSYTNDDTPTLTFSLTDPDDSDQVKHQIQIDDNSDFSSPVIDYTSALEAEGSKSFTVGQAPGSGSYTTGSEGQNLTDGDYYWRVKATDAAGEASSYATANSGSIAFKVDATVPATPGTPSTTTPTTVTTPTWSWDASSDSGSGLTSTPYTVEWCDNSSFTDCSSNSDTDSDTSYTHASALTDGTWYFRVKATDIAGNVSSYSSNGSVVVDTTEPSDFSLDSPGGGVYVNSQRPTLRWNTSSDSGAGLTKYKLSINNGSSRGGFTIDNIPVSRTTTYEVNKYKAEYDGFSDGDSGNNYISVTTKVHSDWSSDQNEGKLKEGKRSWSVVAVDDAGNEKSKSRDINVDLTAPSLSNISVSGSSSSFTLGGTVSDTKAGSNSDESDYVRSDPDKVEIEIIRKSVLLSTTQANVTLSLDTFCDYSDKDSDTLSCSFEKDVEGTFPFGDYVVKVTGFDKAGNSTTTEESLILGGIGMLEVGEREEEEEDLPLPTETPEPDEEGTPGSEDELTGEKERRSERFKRTVEESVRKIKDTVRAFTERTRLVFEVIVSTPRSLITSFINLFNSPKKVLGLATTSTTNRLGYFIAAIFPGAKTQIIDIKIEEVGTTSAVITWKTNHPATSKVNYGENLEFEKSVYYLNPVKEHKVKLEGLAPNTKIYFEVISEGRTTAYDAYRVFTTKED